MGTKLKQTFSEFIHPSYNLVNQTSTIPAGPQTGSCAFMSIIFKDSSSSFIADNLIPLNSSVFYSVKKTDAIPKIIP